MSDKYFIDTNIFVYSFDPKDARKQNIAREIIQNALKDRAGCISSQVMQEFLHVSTKKFKPPLSHQDGLRYLNAVFAPLCEVFTSLDLLRRSMEISDRWQYSLYDSMIVAAALQVNCAVLYSEDLQHGQQIESLAIVNPFLAA